MENKNSTAIGFIGCGTMAQAIMRSLIKSGFSNLFGSDKRAEILSLVSDFAKTFENNQKVLENSKYVFICVKPQDAEGVLTSLNFSSNNIPVSVMAGIPLSKMMKWTKTKKGVRVMPNLNASIGQSHNAYCEKKLDKNEIAELEAMLKTFGDTVNTNEKNMNAITGISGSGPAFTLRYIKGLLMEAQKHGFSPLEAVVTCTNMIKGTMGLVADYTKETAPKKFPMLLKGLDELVDSVCSKGGTTIEGIKHLDANNFSDTVQKAAEKAIKRAEELSK